MPAGHSGLPSLPQTRFKRGSHPSGSWRNPPTSLRGHGVVSAIAALTHTGLKVVILDNIAPLKMSRKTRLAMHIFLYPREFPKQLKYLRQKTYDNSLIKLLFILLLIFFPILETSRMKRSYF